MDNGSDSSAGSINGSWVKLGSKPGSRGSNETSPNLSDNGEDMENLLADAVADSKLSSPEGSISSPRDIYLKGSKQESLMMQWSSRPEIKRGSTYKRQKQQTQRTPSLSLRKTKVMKSGAEIMSLNILVIVPAIVASHAIFLGIGIYIGRNFLCQKGK